MSSNWRRLVFRKQSSLWEPMISHSRSPMELASWFVDRSHCHESRWSPSHTRRKRWPVATIPRTERRSSTATLVMLYPFILIINDGEEILMQNLTLLIPDVPHGYISFCWFLITMLRNSYYVLFVWIGGIQVEADTFSGGSDFLSVFF